MILVQRGTEDIVFFCVVTQKKNKKNIVKDRIRFLFLFYYVLCVCVSVLHNIRRSVPSSCQTLNHQGEPLTQPHPTSAKADYTTKHGPAARHYCDNRAIDFTISLVRSRLSYDCFEFIQSVFFNCCLFTLSWFLDRLTT